MVHVKATQRGGLTQRERRREAQVSPRDQGRQDYSSEGESDSDHETKTSEKLLANPKSKVARSSYLERKEAASWLLFITSLHEGFSAALVSHKDSSVLKRRLTESQGGPSAH